MLYPSNATPTCDIFSILGMTWFIASLNRTTTAAGRALANFRFAPILLKKSKIEQHRKFRKS